MLEDSSSRHIRAQVSHQLQGTVDIQVVVVTQLLAMETVDIVALLSIDRGWLMGIFTISQRSGLRQGEVQLSGVTGSIELIEVVGDGSVVIGGVLKSRSCERLSGCKGDRCLLSILLHEGGVLFRICQEGYMSIIFGACTDHGGAADIGRASCRERVEITEVAVALE